ncbi:MAG: type III-A CRISPR-associated RAMP protein Csm4 [Nitrospinota bacterium]
MKTWQIKLTPLSPLFQGFPASDTLFGAVCWGIKRIYGESKLFEILDGFQKKPEFILSSSFPYLESNNSPLPFYPKPVSIGLSVSDIEEMSGDDKKEKVKVITKYKKFKKSEYVSDSIFAKLLNGLSEKALFNDYRNERIKIEGKMLLTKEEVGKFFKDSKPAYRSESVQKNSIDRLTMSTGEEGQTFYQQEYFTSPIFKLHFLIKTDGINLFKPVFRYLEDKGIGGNRSTGKGRFKIEVIKEVSIGNNSSSKFVTLSRYITDISEIDIKSNSMFYEIFSCRSKVDSEAEWKGEDVWKARVMYLKEGSCLEAKEIKDFYGKVPVVKEIEGQKIYQNGIAFPVFGNFGGSR